ncbi:uncharacterized protein LOC129976040 isoform X1 [Argiope bruennichi]|uniref:uncharacterized protein LOC129975887 isoform X2 n=1 Tax=Argiope bruennichi TaxID=94029 RepID=UPI002493E15D|nr:uncharacterized protein LOC129975887 isoform X2 [Argiope bruennichi]XP_055945134.1 uncharacterized protein LOC129975887 isoform X2 [Argiope bruennichi]XP_055945363.1 uncharacterized protein LOC129976040 isoform X1 [Argiope bruennichi]XP_055945364.1 uncharacterized protein LOC129976040 isoform X1 [Argiope bruennichi]
MDLAADEISIQAAVGEAEMQILADEPPLMPAQQQQVVLPQSVFANLRWYDDPQKSTQSEMFLNDKNFSLETSRDPGCSAGVSGISVPHKEPSMASSSAQADVLSCESLSSGEDDRALGSCPLDSEPEKKKRLKLHLAGILFHSAYSSVIIGVCN